VLTRLLDTPSTRRSRPCRAGSSKDSVRHQHKGKVGTEESSVCQRAIRICQCQTSQPMAHNLRPGPKRIACVATIPTYYAKGTVVGLPYAGSAETLHCKPVNSCFFGKDSSRPCTAVA
jgi:hypothetical protein